ncbi:diguanylate phosphodiesterase [Rhodospirillum rubrum F11]|nr:EAL domain-containing protein [Rhodospirillum rubrum]AEO48176.1 diguanylate phosphodiesterase [Rhodospirillum rubrum F11]
MEPRNERDRYAALAFCWADLIMQIDSRDRIVFAAGPFEAFIDRRQDDLRGEEVATLMVPEDRVLMGQCLKLVRRKGRASGEVVRLYRPRGAPLSMDFAGYTLDQQSFIALRLTSHRGYGARDGIPRDPQSGLLPPQAFSELASGKIKQSQETGQDFGVTVIDLPGLGGLCDRLPSPGALGLLRSVGASLRACAFDDNSATEIAQGRYGLVHDGAADLEALRHDLSEIVRQHDPDGEEGRVETSAIDLEGIDQIDEGDLAKGLIYAINQCQRADGAAISLRMLSTSIPQLVHQGINEVALFRRVVANRSFDIVLQPIVSLSTGDIHHYEALCRFDSSRPDLSPYRAITFAEETGLIHDFDLAMAEKVLGWLSGKPRNSDAYRVAVNISGFSIGVDSYVKGLLDLLRAEPWTKGKMLFEITESSKMTDLDSANSFIGSLRDSGYQVCLDDFGAGAASFQYLSALEVDVVKIDGSAVRNAMRGPKGLAFLSALTELCRRLGVTTIAEMIDTKESLDFVRSCGCDFVQGYLFGRPSADLKSFQPLPNLGLLRGSPDRLRGRAGLS